MLYFCYQNPPKDFKLSHSCMSVCLVQKLKQLPYVAIKQVDVTFCKEIWSQKNNSLKRLGKQMGCQVTNFIIKHTSHHGIQQKIWKICSWPASVQLHQHVTTSRYFSIVPLESVQCSDEYVAQEREVATCLVPWRRPCSWASGPALMDWKKQEDQDEK